MAEGKVTEATERAEMAEGKVAEAVEQAGTAQGKVTESAERAEAAQRKVAEAADRAEAKASEAANRAEAAQRKVTKLFKRLLDSEIDKSRVEALLRERTVKLMAAQGCLSMRGVIGAWQCLKSRHPDSGVTL